MRRLLIALGLLLAITPQGNAQTFTGNLPTDSLLGRDTAGVGPVESITIGTGLGFNGSKVLAITDAELLALAGLTSAADKGLYFTGAGTAAVYDLSSYGRTLGNLADETALEALLDTLPNVTSVGTSGVTLHGPIVRGVSGVGGYTGGYPGLVMGLNGGSCGDPCEWGPGLYAAREDPDLEPFFTFVGYSSGTGDSTSRTIYFGGGGWDAPAATHYYWYLDTDSSTESGETAFMHYYPAAAGGDVKIWLNNGTDIAVGDGSGIYASDALSEQLIFQQVGSAENYLEITNAADGAGPILAAVGDDTDVALNLVPKGTGAVAVTNDLTVADDLSLTSDGAVINIGSANDCVLTHSSNTLTLTGCTASGFGSGSQTPWTANVDADGFNLLFDDSTGILSSEGGNAEILEFVSVASAVNFLELTNAATGGSPVITAVGDDADVGIKFVSKGEPGVDLGLGFNVNVGFDLTAQSASPKLGLLSTADGSNGPTVDMFADSDSPTANDTIANIRGWGKNTTPGVEQYSDWRAIILDATPSGEDGEMRFQATINSTLTTQMRIRNGVTLGPQVDPGTGSLAFASAGAIKDSGANELIQFPSAVASAVNEITVSNAATGNPPTISATGGDTNISLQFSVKGDAASTRDGLAIFNFGDYNSGTYYPGLFLENTTSNGYGPAITFNSLRTGTATAGDYTGVMEFRAEDNGGTELAYGYIFNTIADPTDTSEDGRMDFRTVVAGTNRVHLQLEGRSVLAGEDNVTQLGSTARQWADLFLGDGAVTNWNNGDVTLTHAANTLTVAGGDLVVPTEAYDEAGWNGDNSVPTKDALRDKIETLGGGGASTALDNLAAVAINTSLVSDTNDTDDLGSSSVAWNELYVTEVELGHATENTLTAASGVLSIEGVALLTSTSADALFLTPAEGDTLFLTAAEGNAAYQPLDADLTTLSTAFTTASGSGAASLALHEDTDNGTNRVLLQGAASTADVTLTLQSTTGTVYSTGGTDVAVADGGTGASSLTDLIQLGTHTTNNYVATVADGTGIDGTASGEGTTYTPTLDLTEINTFTLGGGSATGIIFDAGATDPAIEVASGSLTIDIGGTNELVLNATNLTPGANDGNALGVSGTAWADLFLASGGLIEFDGGTTNSLTCTGGNCTIEGNGLYRAGGTDVAIADGGTGQSSASAGFNALAEVTSTTAGKTILDNADPAAHSVLGWNDTGNAYVDKTLGTGLSTDADSLDLDSDLATIAGLTATTDNFMIGASSAWASRTPAQAKTSLGLQTSTTDNQIVRYDSTAGNQQGSPLTIADTTGTISTAAGFAIEFDGNTSNTFTCTGGACTIEGNALGGATIASESEYWAGSDTTKALGVKETWDAAAFVALSDAATITVDMDTFLNGSVTLAGDRTLGNPTNEKPGQSGVFAFSASTSTRTLTLASEYKVQGGVPAFPIAIETDETVYVTYFVTAADNVLITGVFSVDGDQFGGFVKLATGSFSAVSTLDFILTPYGTSYRAYKIILTGVDFSADADLDIRTDSDGGASFDTGASDYAYTAQGYDFDTNAYVFGDDANDEIAMCTSEGSTAGTEQHFDIMVWAPNETVGVNVSYEMFGLSSDGTTPWCRSVGFRESAADVDAVRFFPSTGTITGDYLLLGLR